MRDPVVTMALPALAAPTAPRVYAVEPENWSWPLDPIEAVIPLACNWLFNEATTCAPVSPLPPPLTVATAVDAAPVGPAMLKVKLCEPPARNCTAVLFRLTKLPVNAVPPPATLEVPSPRDAASTALFAPLRLTFTWAFARLLPPPM